MVQERKEESATAMTKDEDLHSENNEEKDVDQANDSIDEVITDDEKNAEIEMDQTNDELLEELQKQNNQLKQEKEELYNRMLRIQAEYDNYKKRTQRERTAERKYKSQDLATELLPALDNFERALSIEITDETKSIIEGISMVYRQIQEALKAEGIEMIESVGKEFDPNLHHAVMQVEDESKESNIIVEELQKGYMLEDRVIRPAMVKVNK